MKYHVEREVLLQITVEAGDRSLAEQVAADTDLDYWTAETKSERITPIKAPLTARLYDLVKQHIYEHERETLWEAIELAKIEEKK